MLLDQISASTGLPTGYLYTIAVSASHRYKIYYISKRGKTKGKREIAHPSRPLKLLQRWLSKEVFSHLPVHDTVHSYRKGRGILNNAIVHRQNNYLMRIDFKDFFHSIKADDVRWLLNRNESNLPFEMTEEDLILVTKIVCRHEQLTI